MLCETDIWISAPPHEFQIGGDDLLDKRTKHEPSKDRVSEVWVVVTIQAPPLEVC